MWKHTVLIPQQFPPFPDLRCFEQYMLLHVHQPVYSVIHKLYLNMITNKKKKKEGKT